VLLPLRKPFRFSTGAHCIPANQRLSCTLGSKLPAGTPVFKRGMNGTGVFEDAAMPKVLRSATGILKGAQHDEGKEIATPSGHETDPPAAVKKNV